MGASKAIGRSQRNWGDQKTIGRYDSDQQAIGGEPPESKHAGDQNTLQNAIERFSNDRGRYKSNRGADTKSNRGREKGTDTKRSKTAKRNTQHDRGGSLSEKTIELKHWTVQ